MKPKIIWLPIESQRISYLHNEAVAHDADAITHGHRFDLIVRHVNHCIIEPNSACNREISERI
jgi:hypothetical protein